MLIVSHSCKKLKIFIHCSLWMLFEWRFLYITHYNTNELHENLIMVCSLSYDLLWSLCLIDFECTSEEKLWYWNEISWNSYLLLFKSLVLFSKSYLIIFSLCHLSVYISYWWKFCGVICGCRFMFLNFITLKLNREFLIK